MQNLKELSGGTIEVNHFDVIASIMADLQEEHDLNGVGWFQKAIQVRTISIYIKLFSHFCRISALGTDLYQP